MTPLDLDESHDLSHRSWVESANVAGTDFPIQNLPFGIFRITGESTAPRGGVAIGDCVLDVSAVAAELEEAGGLAELLAAPTLRPLMSLEPVAWRQLRLAIFRLLDVQSANKDRVTRHLHPMRTAEMFLPVRPGGFVDFFASIQHATNAGSLFRPDAPLHPNYKHVPIGYNGRTSTIVVSGVPVRRPSGQTRPVADGDPVFGPSRRLDFEAELGIFLGGQSVQGTPVPLQQAWQHIFGFCLLNDWSARDIQAWEYQPLGPFLGKSFGTTISPWIVTAGALLPFRGPIRSRASDDPRPMPYLDDADDKAYGAIDVLLETSLVTPQMSTQRAGGIRLGRASTRGLFWSVGQMLAHHTSNGCYIEPGDLYGSGTVSGDGDGAFGSLLEITAAGQKYFELPGGERRTFLEDGDEVIMTGRCAREGFASIGFGRCVGRVDPPLRV